MRFHLPIQLRRDDIDAAEDGDDVADHVAFDELWEDLVIDVARRAGADAPGDALAGADDVVAQLAAGGIDAVVDFALWGFEATVGHNQLEVMDESFDAAVDLVLGRQRFLSFGADVDGAAGDVVDE